MFENPTPRDAYIQNVNGLSPFETALAKAYLQGCVYGWCKNNGTSPFRAQFFLGGDNYFWQCTPMFAVYTKRVAFYNGDCDLAAEQAGKDAGWLLKDVLKQDKRSFRTWTGEDGFRWYEWNGERGGKSETHPEYSDYIIEAKRLLEPRINSFL